MIIYLSVTSSIMYQEDVSTTEIHQTRNKTRKLRKTKPAMLLTE